jgi:hypothetical protein
LGDELLELAETIHFIPLNGFVEWALHDVTKMNVGTMMNGHLRIRTQSEEEYLEGTIYVMPDGLQFDHA